MKIEPGSLDGFLSRMKEDSEQLRSMINYCRSESCLFDRTAMPSKKVMRAHGVYKDNQTGFIWWLLEQYLKGNLIKKEDAQPEP